MASTYSNLKIQLMTTGENTTTWGTVTNTNLGTAIEEAIVGSADVTFASGNVTLSLTDTNSTQTARNMRLRCTGTTGGSTRNLVVPSIEKPYIVQNDCADSILVKTAAGSGITIPAGKSAWVYSNGTDVVDVTTYLTSLSLSTALDVTSGGTGSNTASGARANLSAAASGANSDITSLSGLTTPLTTAQGGTGSASTTYCNLTANVAGTLPIANGGTGVNTAATNGQLLIGNGTGFTLATITQGSGITVTNGAGTITIAASSSMVYPGAGIAVSTGSAWTTSLTAPSGTIVGTTDTQNLTNKTLTTGNTLDAGTSISDTGTIAATSPGFRGVPQSTNTTLALTDAGKHIYTSSNVTIPANGSTAFPVGTTVVIANSGSSTLTISITTDTLRQSGTTNTGTRTLAAYGLATIVKVTSTVWFISGNVS